MINDPKTQKSTTRPQKRPKQSTLEAEQCEEASDCDQRIRHL
nr:MAG TPA: hypothetical protein [Microviridae sp.]